MLVLKLSDLTTCVVQIQSLSSSSFQVKNRLTGLVPRRSARTFPYMPVVEVYNSIFFRTWPCFFDYIQCGTQIMKSPLPSYSHFLGPKCSPQLSNTSMLFPCRTTNHLTQPSNKIRCSSFLFKKCKKYTLLHVTHESDHTLCTVISIIHQSLEFSVIWFFLINKVLTKARRLTG